MYNTVIENVLIFIIMHTIKVLVKNAFSENFSRSGGLLLFDETAEFDPY